MVGTFPGQLEVLPGDRKRHSRVRPFPQGRSPFVGMDPMTNSNENPVLSSRVSLPSSAKYERVLLFIEGFLGVRKRPPQLQSRDLFGKRSAGVLPLRRQAPPLRGIAL